MFFRRTPVKINPISAENARETMLHSRLVNERKDRSAIHAEKDQQRIERYIAKRLRWIYRKIRKAAMHGKKQLTVSMNLPYDSYNEAWLKIEKDLKKRNYIVEENNLNGQDCILLLKTNPHIYKATIKWYDKDKKAEYSKPNRDLISTVKIARTVDFVRAAGEPERKRLAERYSNDCG